MVGPARTGTCDAPPGGTGHTGTAAGRHAARALPERPGRCVDCKVWPWPTMAVREPTGAAKVNLLARHVRVGWPAAGVGDGVMAARRAAARTGTGTSGPRVAAQATVPASLALISVPGSP